MKRLSNTDERLDRLAALSERREGTMAELVSITKHQEERQESLDINMDWLKEMFFELKWERKATSYLGSHGFRKLRILSQSQLADILDDLFDEDLLGEEDRLDILNVDSVATAIKKSDSNEVYIVAELASRVHSDDVERVIRRALLLEVASSKHCEKVVAGASIDDVAVELAKNKGVIVITPREWAQKVA